MAVSKRGKGRPSQDKAMRPHTFDRLVVEFLDGLPDGDRSQYVNDAVIASEAFHHSPQFEQWKQSPAYGHWLKRNSTHTARGDNHGRSDHEETG